MLISWSMSPLALATCKMVCFVVAVTCRLGTWAAKRAAGRAYSEGGTARSPAVWRGENKNQADSERCCPGLCQGESLEFTEGYSLKLLRSKCWFLLREPVDFGSFFSVIEGVLARVIPYLWLIILIPIVVILVDYHSPAISSFSNVVNINKVMKVLCKL